jgi:hypothetical protein
VKTCIKCLASKDEALFPVRKGRSCNVCRDCRNAYHREYNKRYPKRGEVVAASSLHYRRALRLQVFTHYGLRCAACGEDDFDVLEMDHINNDGAAHRLQIANMTKDGHKRGPGGHRLYYWLKQNGFPSGFQTLCANCNIAKQKNGGVIPARRMAIRGVVSGGTT